MGGRKTPESPLEALVLAAFGGEQEPPPAVEPEIAIARLRAETALYGNPCPFKPGDLVTVRANSASRNAGQPHIVLEVLDTPVTCWEGGPGDTHSNSYGRRINVRVATLCDNQLAAFWMEHWTLVPYEASAGSAA